ncbi:5'/3'-nucleotidase SurE [Streptomyces sp. NPDC050523]|uniref:5'/3'-nucleotidase SurE n=1 Tax=Streptomyces sp. NPDC050523 TaxID=3365622 RepID=UPI0037961075
MRILLCNDDGLNAPGIQVLKEHLAKQGHDIVTVAPAGESSGKSHAMTFDRPVMVEQISAREFAVHGTPADCAFIGLCGLMADSPPHFLVSGVNHGLNLGVDVNYSGTIGAASQAALLGYRAIAASVDLERSRLAGSSPEQAFERAAQLVAEPVERLAHLKWPARLVLSLNHPGIEPRGIKPANCHAVVPYAPRLVSLTTEDSSRRQYLIDGVREDVCEDVEQDLAIVLAGYVSVSFLDVRQSISYSDTLVQALFAALGARTPTLASKRSSRLKLRWLKTVVVSVGKSVQEASGGDRKGEQKRTADEVPKQVADIKTGAVTDLAGVMSSR